MSMTIRSYSELMQFQSIEERFRYLALRSGVGDSTFGFERYINQQFYRSREWKQIRYHVIARDLARDLAVEGYEIHGRLVIHHMNPMGVEEIVGGDSSILDPEFLITTAHQTHNAIHYGDETLLPHPVITRTPGDTKLW